MNKPAVYWRSSIFGAICGFIFGGLFEVANRIRFEFELREVESIAARGGPIIDIAYALHWWVLPCFFMLVFTVVTLLLSWLRANRPSPKPDSNSAYRLRGKPVKYDAPTEPVAEDEWSVLR